MSSLLGSDHPAKWWWTHLILPLAVGAIVRNRLHELRRQRYATAQLLR